MPATVTASAAVTRTRLIRHPVPAGEPVRTMEPEAWRIAGTPLLRHPRGLVKRLHDLHRPEAGTAVVAVLDADDRPVASASFALDPGHGALDGWECRNIILAHLRMIIPDDLRRAAPVRTTVLLLCRDGDRGWQPADGPWMWGLRDACGLHGLRCGAVVVLAENGWQVIGDGRGGRTPVPIRTSTPADDPTPVAPSPENPPPTTPRRPQPDRRAVARSSETVPGTPPPPRAEIPAQRTRPDVPTAPPGDDPNTRAIVRLVPDAAAELRYSSA